MKHRARVVALSLLTLGLPAAWGAERAFDPAGIQKLQQDIRGVQVSLNPATGGARFVRLPGSGSLISTPALRGVELSAADKAQAFFSQYGAAFGIQNAARELRSRGTRSDALGWTHISYEQVYGGVPVFASGIKAHFDAQGNLRAVNGTFVPDIQVSTQATRSQADAGATALKRVGAQKGSRGLVVRSSRLVVFREGLIKGVEGANHLAWAVEVGNGSSVREFVYVDAHSGKVIDQYTGIYEAMDRRSYDGKNLNGVPPEYPNTPWWVEGNTFPTTTGNPTCVQAAGAPDCNNEANNMIQSSFDTYNLFFKTFGRDSFDGAGKKMDSIFDRGYSCPNASWNSTFISFCPGFTTDDVTGHEWAHAYTEYTDGLIYAWQPGALNEAYSDIWGETIDQNNGLGIDTPNTARSTDCSTFAGTPPPVLTISGGTADGTYQARASVNEPARPFTIGPLAMELSVPAGACSAITSNVAGKIVIIDWTLNPNGSNQCGSGTRAANAIAANAAGIIFVAPAAGLLNLGSNANIGSVEILNSDGATIKAGITGATATMTLGVGTENSVRWLMGEEVGFTGNADGALRDMWNARCFGNPGKVSDTFEYVCGPIENDQGGVHTNSGVPNHAYALLVDGGTFNGHTVAAIGFVKAAHIYFRAQSVYQGEASGFPEHADALEQSCDDLKVAGTDLLGFDGLASGQIISAADCTAVAEAMLAVEMRANPTQCNFQPLLAKTPPARCSFLQTDLLADDFEADPTSSWAVSHAGVNAEFTPRDWEWVGDLPDKTGKAFFAIDDPSLGTCAAGGDESGALFLDSPTISLPLGSVPRITFQHYVQTEGGYDGGNLRVSVNGGAYQVVPSAAYIYNPYNATLLATNPLAGQAGFSGTDAGKVVGSWGESQVDLAGIAGPGDSIKLRWAFGNDGCGGNLGWFLDDVAVYSCNPSILSSDTSIGEGNSGASSVDVVVTLSAPFDQTVNVDWATSGGTASGVTDFVSASGTLTFAAGETSKTISIDVNGDSLYEGDEYFWVNLSNPVNGMVPNTKVKVTITEDDPVPVGISVNNVTGSEGAGTLTFTVTLSALSSAGVTVDYTTLNGTARAGSDFAATGGTLVFGPADLTQQIVVPIFDDTKKERAETFFVRLSNPTNGGVLRQRIGRGLITNND